MIKDQIADQGEVARKRSQKLKKSLSETLTRFYPFAGRLSSSSLSIDCNDQGVKYVETRVKCRLQDIQPDGDQSLAKLMPPPATTGTESLVRVKVNFFECGGMAIGITISHKVGDVSTMKLFINTWAAMTQQGSISDAVPDFTTIPSLFPTMDFPGKPPQYQEVAFRRLVFDASKIPMLKAQVASKEVAQPSRVEAVVALLWKCARAAATTNRAQITTSTLEEETELSELQSLVKQIRDGMRDQFSESCMRKLQGSDGFSEITAALTRSGSLMSQGDDFDIYTCTSWCKFQLYESADFGWGKPKWVTYFIQYYLLNLPNTFVLMDSSDGEGIEARVTMDEDEMPFFECNQELLAFASVNPCVQL
ncbi:Transferase [Corchorus capsularis]|uniref:Transferase n=1 Tax=Corchorus capsularis TaxID=210143 RepID=A0A1R3HE21_COCAP|nr:Transferase [Corchorus capsularis]